MTRPIPDAALSNLVMRLARCVGGSRDLDCDLAEALFPIEVDRGGMTPGVWAPEMIVSAGEIEEVMAFHEIMHYSKSIDAARTLIPAGWRVSHAYWDAERAHFTLTKAVGIYADGDALDPACALSIASLRADALADWVK